MMKRIVKTKLITPTHIKVDVFPLSNLEHIVFDLIINEQKVSSLCIIKRVKNIHEHYFILDLREEIVLGYDYKLYCYELGYLNIDLSYLAQTDDFDEKYAYDGDDLGSSYTPTNTTFVLWAPLASRVRLKYFFKKKWCYVDMERFDRGVYRVVVKGNLDGFPYLYEVTNGGETIEVSDPYAKLALQNNKASVVSNPKKYQMAMNEEFLPKFDKYTEAIVYEAHVRDMTIDQNSNIVHKGTFKGLIEKGRKTKGGNPAGFDYIKMLGITHLQLLPIFDFATVDEENPDTTYNWGYDPAQYFVPEGSYASNPGDPYSRIIDLKKMVAAFHQAGIRIVMDTVFNHVYEHYTSVFERVVPNYYFRREKNGEIAQRSFCGNDVASERKMTRKLIVDACVYYVKEFGVDGFRFDIMGLIDLETMQIVKEKVKAIKPDFIIYGEGWQMGDETTQNFKMASFSNAMEMKDIGFFNDWYRDIVRGKTSDHDQLPRGYLLNSDGHRDGFKYCYVGSSFEFYITRRFIDPQQSINYIECHDNGTIFDKLEVAMPQEAFAARLERIKMINAVVLASFGIPFIHMGQEIGLSKKNWQNTYKAGDDLNKMDYAVLDERFELARYTKDAIKLRRELTFLQECDLNKIEQTVSFEDLDNNAVKISYDLATYETEFKDFLIFVNPSLETIYYDLDEYYQILFASGGNVLSSKTFVKHVMIKARSFLILILK
ncbi:MAG: type I pullulanase [Bacilli bacterium]|jgi:pullulanase|nr:type I pullulanase [Bacilli bacterium]